MNRSMTSSAALPLNSRIRYRPEGPGLKSWRAGVLLAITARLATVRPRWPRNADPIEIPRRHVRAPKPQAPRPVAKLLPLPQPAAPVVVVVARGGPARLDGTYYAPDARPRPRLLDPDFLTFIKHRSCELCAPGEQATETQIAHLGPRGVSRKTHDRLSNSLCSLHHQKWWHGKGHFQGLSPEASRLLLLAGQVANLLQYFEHALQPAQPWYALADVVDRLPFGGQERYLRGLLDVLHEHLALVAPPRRAEGRAA